ncbi:MAG: hypothetical protein ABIK09_15340 [Pseudomonadota bacterium]
MRRSWTLAFAGFVALSAAGCGDGGGATEADVPEADVAEVLSWESIGAPLLGGFMKVESYGCREDAIFVAVSGGQVNNIYKLDLDDVQAGWQELNDQSAQLEPTEDHLLLAFPEGKT